MSAFHKALQSVWRIPMFEVKIECTGRGENVPPRDKYTQRLRPPRSVAEEIANRFDHRGACVAEHIEEAILDCPTKLEGIKNAKEEGWTYDKNGNWLCLYCSKEGE